MDNFTLSPAVGMGNSIPFDPYQQTFTLFMSDGVTPFNVSIPQLDEFILYNTQICINYGAQIGASIILFTVLLLLTKPDKRNSTIFIINTLSLGLNIIRNILLCLFYTGNFSESYAYFSGDYSHVITGDYAKSVTAAVFEMLVLVSIEASLCLQTWVVCVTIRPIYRRFLLAFSLLVALTAICLRMVFMVKNSVLIVAAADPSSILRLAYATTVATCVSICWFSAVFVTKLGFALDRRRKLKMGSYGSMQILFIMGCQTLIVPALFSILQFFVDNPAMGSNVITAVAIFLPLSSLWAAASIDSRFQAPKEQNYSKNNLFGSNGSGSTGPLVGRKMNINGLISPSNTATTTNSSPHAHITNGLYKDLEAQDLAEAPTLRNEM